MGILRSVEGISLTQILVNSSYSRFPGSNLRKSNGCLPFLSALDKVVISRKTVYRLSLYQRCLNRLQEDEAETVSSEDLAHLAGIKPTQIRKDLACIGQFGTRGLGYNVATLSKVISSALGLSASQPIVIVGVGNLGSALLHYGGFRKEGFEIIAAFDADPDRVKARGELEFPIHHVRDLGSFVREHGVRMAIIAVPEAAGQEIADILVNAGIQAILNFSPTVLKLPESIGINQMDLAAELRSLSFFLR